MSLVASILSFPLHPDPTPDMGRDKRVGRLPEYSGTEANMPDIICRVVLIKVDGLYHSKSSRQVRRLFQMYPGICFETLDSSYFFGSGSETCITHAGPFRQHSLCGLDYLDTKDFPRDLLWNISTLYKLTLGFSFMQTVSNFHRVDTFSTTANSS